VVDHSQTRRVRKEARSGPPFNNESASRC
jgi:hypothetical protein